jgi:hypothetical protein
MSDEYVAIRRRFRRVDEAPETSRLRRLMRVGPPTDWEALLPSRAADGASGRSALVILAPSGAGKTRELEAQTTRLANAGVAAFHIAGVALATRGVRGALDEGVTFDSWKATTGRAVFIVDAIDEARLERRSV